MKILKHLFLSALLAGSLPGVVRAQTNSIETDANLKDTTTHVVVERKVIETTKTYQQDTPRDVQRKIAIIVQNRGSAALNDKVPVLEDLVSSRVAGKGFTVLSRDDVTRSLKDYSTGKDPNGELGALDRSLEDNSSALRLAQNLGADYILVPSIVSLGTEKKNYSGNGINTLNITHRLRVTYKIVEAGQGGAVRGGAFTSEKTLRQTPDLQTDSNDVINDLLDDAAEQLADAIVKNATSLPAEVAKAAMVNFNVSLLDDRSAPAADFDLRARHHRRQPCRVDQSTHCRPGDGRDGGIGRSCARLRARLIPRASGLAQNPPVA